MSSPRTAFTLLEICLTLTIGAVLMLLAVPSVAGLLAEQRLHESYERFQKFADNARAHSLREQQPYTLVWQRHGIALIGVERDAHGEPVVVDQMGFDKDEVFDLERPAALTKKPAAEWTFWPSGVCEPAIVSYKGPSGHWRVSFSALTSRGIFIRSEAL